MLIFLWIGCKNDISEAKIDVTSISTNNQWVRFDSVLYSAKKTHSIKKVFDLKKSSPAFFDLYFSEIIPISQTDSLEFSTQIDTFLNHEKISLLLDTVHIVFPDIEALKQEMNVAMKYYMYYFPGKHAPDFYTIISEFGYQCFIFGTGKKDGIGISLDMFLGEDFPYKKVDPTNPAFSEYLTKNYKRENIVRKSLQVLIEDNFEGFQGNNLLDIMVKEGKILYIIEKLLPDYENSYILEYDDQEMEWCENNELQIWNFFLDKELLFNPSLFDGMRYINPSPNSAGMPDAAPGRTGSYIGWKMVKNFMKKNKNLSLMDLIQHNNSQEIMESYKPARK